MACHHGRCDCIGFQTSMIRLGLWNDVIIGWDEMPSNYKKLDQQKVWEDTDYHMIITLPPYPKTIISVKNNKESVDRKTFI